MVGLRGYSKSWPTKIPLGDPIVLLARHTTKRRTRPRRRPDALHCRLFVLTFPSYRCQVLHPFTTIRQKSTKETRSDDSRSSGTLIHPHPTHSRAGGQRSRRLYIIPSHASTAKPRCSGKKWYSRSAIPKFYLSSGSGLCYASSSGHLELKTLRHGFQVFLGLSRGFLIGSRIL